MRTLNQLAESIITEGSTEDLLGHGKQPPSVVAKHLPQSQQIDAVRSQRILPGGKKGVHKAIEHLKKAGWTAEIHKKDFKDNSGRNGSFARMTHPEHGTIDIHHHDHHQAIAFGHTRNVKEEVEE
jgi:hypothetical protein